MKSFHTGRKSVSRNARALLVLTTVRQKLLDRLADAIVVNEEAMQAAASQDGAGPWPHPVEELLARLERLETAITGLKARDAHSAPLPSAAAVAQLTPDVQGCEQAFDRYVSLVEGQRLEEASRELSRVLRMPLDRMVTATRFFDRAFRADASVRCCLAELSSTSNNTTDAELMRLLVRTFGFQAVESRMAIDTLHAMRRQQPGGNGSATASGATHIEHVVPSDRLPNDELLSRRSRL